MNQTADFNSFESGVPIADKALPLKVRCFMAFLDVLKDTFGDTWNPREHGAFTAMFNEHWKAVGPEGMPERVAELAVLAHAAKHRAKNPPAYFTQCAKKLLQGET